MKPQNNKSALTDRLITCIDRMGGKRAMASAALVSESQLFRYINGDTDIPAVKLNAMAKAAKVDAGWLLSGEGTLEGLATEVIPSFRPELLVQVVQVFEELLIESDKRFTPRQKAHAVTLIYEALRLEELRKGTDIMIDKRLAPFYPDYLAPLRSDSRMEDYLATMHALEHGGEASVQSIKQFDTLVKIGLMSVYEGSVGEVYFDRIGTSLAPVASKRLLDIVARCQKLTGKTNLDWLDTGCGTGRHLSLLAQHAPNLKLHGFDLSKLALAICNSLVQSGKLPIGTVQEADLRNMPYANESMDVVYCRASLQVLPHISGHPVGAAQFMAEVSRVLRPGGVVTILTPHGNGRDYVNFIQYYNPQSIQELAKETGFKVITIEPAPMNENEGTSGKDHSDKLNTGLLVTLQK